MSIFDVIANYYDFINMDFDMGKLAHRMYHQCLKKKVLRTKEYAEALAIKISKKIGKQISYYLCPICLNYHLTSKIQEKHD